MLEFRRTPVRHRVVFAAIFLRGTYEIELYGTRWHVRAYLRGVIHAVGSRDGFGSFEAATFAAEADAAIRAAGE